MIEQARGLQSNPAMMLIDDADKPAKWYFALKQRRLDRTRRAPAARPRGAALAVVACAFSRQLTEFASFVR